MTVPPRAEQAPFSSPEEKVKSKARALGFDAVGFARADEPLEQDYERYRDFIASGKHGEMGCSRPTPRCASGSTRRRSWKGRRASSAWPGATSEAPPRRRAIRRRPGLSRVNARGQDYHNAVRRQLRKLAAYLRTLGTEAEPIRARPICDDAPVLERAWAARAGLGFVGKNGLLIVPGVGSFVLLGGGRDQPPTDPRYAHRRALRELYALPRRVPHAGLPSPLRPRRAEVHRFTSPSSSAPPSKPSFAGHRRAPLRMRRLPDRLPFQRRGGALAKKRPRRSCPPEGIHAPAARIAPFLPLERWATVSVTSLLAVLDDADWEGVSRGSPVKRATREGLARKRRHRARESRRVFGAPFAAHRRGDPPFGDGARRGDVGHRPHRIALRLRGPRRRRSGA